MRYEIILAPEAIQDVLRLKPNRRAEVRDGLEQHLRNEPVKTSRSRIKRLRGLSRPQYRLRIGDDIRVFYDVRELTVEVLAIIDKHTAEKWLTQHGVSDAENPEADPAV